MATLQQLAEELGISVSTVSRVVNEKGYVKTSTRERVIEAVKRYSYIPDNAARSLKTGRTKTIGVIIPDVTEVFFTNVLSAIEEGLSSANYNMLLCITGEDKLKEQTYLQYFSQGNTDGIILATVSDNNKPLIDALENGRRIVCIDNLPNIQTTYSAVISDNIFASEIAINYLNSLGHRQIGVIAGKQTETTGIDRLIGYHKAMQILNIPTEENLIRIGDFKEQSGYEAMMELLKKNPTITAVYVASAKMTYGAVRAIIDSGLKIPKDISVVGFDIHDPTGLLQPSITTILQQEENIGRIACQLLLDRIRNPETNVYPKILLRPVLEKRGTCRSVKGV